MNFILCILSLSAVAILFASVIASSEGDKEETTKMCKSMAADCLNSTTGATDKDVQDMCDRKQPTTRPGKCLLQCMLHQFNCMENDEFNGSEFMDLMKMSTDNNKTLTMANEVVNECQDKKDPKGDKCETAAIVMQCMEDGAIKLGFEGI